MDEQLQEIFRKVFSDSELILKDEMTAKDVSGWDSLNHINLIAAVEGSFSIKFSMREITSLRSVGELKELISQKTVS